MTDTLLIDFTKPDSSLAWASFNNGIQHEKGLAESLAELSELAEKQRVVVWISAEHVVLNSLFVPAGQQRYLQRILPGLLEDNVASDIDTLHFVHGGVSADSLVNVATIERELLEDYLALFNEAGIRPHVMLPASLAVTMVAEGSSLQVEGELSLLRTSPQSAYVFDTQNLASILPLMLNEASPSLSLYSADNQRDSLAIAVPYEWQGEPSEKTAVLPDEAVLAMNLLQGEFVPQSDFKKHYLRWRSVAVLMICAVIVQFTSVAIETWQLNKQASQYKTDIAAVFRTAFPDEKRLVNPKAQMTQRLSRLQSQQEGMGFLMLLQQAAPVIKQSGNVAISRINFEQGLGEIKIDLSAQDYAQLESLKGRLEKLGFDVDLGSVSGNKGAYTTRVTIKGAQ